MQPDVHAAQQKLPLPPVRTRWQSDESRRPGPGDLLGPVLSGLFRGMTAGAPAAPASAAPGHEPEATMTAPAEAPEDQPWLDTPAIEEYEASEILLELSVDDSEELEILEAAAQPGGEAEAQLTEAVETDTGIAGLQPVGAPIEGEPLRAAPAPLSAWDLTRERELRLNRVREEWEELGKALVDSLGDITPLDTADTSWPAQAQPAADVEPAEVPEVEGLEPIGAGSGREAEPVEAAADGDRQRRALEELAERLETFAASLRTEGRYAISRAQLSGDRMDSMLAGFAAGWFAAHGE